MSTRTTSCCVLFATLLASDVVAHAAPPVPGPAPAPSPTPAPAPGLKPKVVEKVTPADVEVLPAAGRCGEPLKQKVKLTLNSTTNGWRGMVTLVGAGGSKSQYVELAPIPGFNPKEIVLPTANPLDCTKPLGSFEIRVTNGDERSVWFTKSVRPRTVKAEQGFNAPPPNDLAPWLRRVTLNGTCGGTLSATAGLHTFSPQPKPAKVKLSLGATIKEETVQVQTTNTFVTVETGALECQTAVIPSFEYALLDGHPASGKLAPSELTFTPD